MAHPNIISSHHGRNSYNVENTGRQEPHHSLNNLQALQTIKSNHII